MMRENKNDPRHHEPVRICQLNPNEMSRAPIKLSKLVTSPYRILDAKKLEFLFTGKNVKGYSHGRNI